MSPRDAQNQITAPGYLSRVERGQFIARCMAEQGWVGEVDPVSGGVNISFGDPAQEEAMHQAFLDCVARGEELVGPPPEETPEYRAKLYLAWLWTHQCLIDHEYPATDPPSLDVFVEQAGSVEGGWSPYDFLRDDVDLAFDVYEVEDTCPNDPFFLFAYLDLDE